LGKAKQKASKLDKIVMVTSERKYVFHEANKCVDALTKQGCQQAEDFVIFHLPLSYEVSIMVDLDAIGLYSKRLTTVSIF
jgi:hypothetical protein